jgi:predicted RecA/RadA family phage recombinase
MAKLFEKKPVSDHIEIAAFPAAKSKGEIVKFGSLIGFSDYDTALGAPGSVDTGKPAAVFQAAIADLTGTAAVGSDVYITAGEALTMTAASNFLIGTIVQVGSDTFDLVRV